MEFKSILGGSVLLCVVLIIFFSVLSPYYMFYPASGDSMQPTYDSCRITIVDTYDDQNIENGSVIIFNHTESKIIVHRVISQSKSYVVTQGDANPKTVELVEREDIIGIETGTVDIPDFIC